MPNHLVGESSPYLQQHQDNPVDWYPWGAEALSRAEKEVKPIFLSIGYASCHWCHVMAHESFEDQQTADMLNENFINIKVDREERPDLDTIYMQAVILLTGQGGWPMSVFLTPDLKPFYGGTYFPPSPRYGMPSFGQVLRAVVNAWQQKRTDILSSAQQITNAIQDQFRNQPPKERYLIDLDKITSTLYQSYDWNKAGWGQAPKFPQPMLIDFLIQRASNNDLEANRLVNHYLERIARGGMFDLV